MAPYRDRKESLDQLERIEAKLDELLEWKDGTLESPGITVRVDRLEQFQNMAKWVIGATAMAAISSIVALVWAKIQGKSQ
jgi:hypothetical protein